MDAELYDLFSYSGIIDKASEYIEKKLWLRNISKKTLCGIIRSSIALNRTRN